MAASICAACTKLSNQGRQQLKTGPGLLDLLIKSASHPSVQICAISLEVLTQLLLPSNNEQNNSNNSGLAHQLLPILQRRAITPHQFGGSEGNFPSLVVATDHLCGVNIHDFQLFRETALSESLVACWNAVSHEHYFASCTAAIEEFCSVTATVQVSFHLEAALFCMEAVAEEALAGGGTGADFSSFLERCSTALGLKPESLSSNPFTLAQACRFVRKYDKWFSSNAGAILDTGADLALSTFNLCATTFPEEAVSVEMKREVDVSPYKEAALALDGVLCQAPQHFLSNQAIAALGGKFVSFFCRAIFFRFHINDPTFVFDLIWIVRNSWLGGIVRSCESSGHLSVGGSQSHMSWYLPSSCLLARGSARKIATCPSHACTGLSRDHASARERSL